MKLTWTQPKTYTDGSVFGAVDFAGYEISVDDSPAVGIPVQWNDTGKYTFDLANLQLADGEHLAELRVVAKNGAKSDFSGSVAFTHARVPSAPLDLAAA